LTESNLYALAVHGGAGNDLPGEAPPGTDAERRAALVEAVAAAAALLREGGTALDAVIRAVVLLEDCPLFNAGRGSVLAADGAIEMDAAVMDGRTGRAGGVSCVRTVRNPVLAARAVMEGSPHALLSGTGAEGFAAGHGLAMVENAWFATPHRIRQLERARARGGAKGSRSTGTVGCVARDRAGDLAAATSTGGITDKAPGRVSDSSIPGAGTWARNGVCAVSCTGTGDVFIANATAREIAALVEHRGLGLAEACAQGLGKVEAMGGHGGVIAVDAAGRLAVERNAERMAWASVRDGEEIACAP